MLDRPGACLRAVRQVGESTTLPRLGSRFEIPSPAPKFSIISRHFTGLGRCGPSFFWLRKHLGSTAIPISAQRWDTFGCAQIANQFSDCVPTVPTTTLIGTQNSTWQSLRVGMNSEVMLVPGLKLSADVAYLPYVSMTGRDNHLLRTTTTFFDQQGTGQGVQLEAIMSYYVTDNFSVGVGGRYWAMWTTSGTDHLHGLRRGRRCLTIKSCEVQYRALRYLLAGRL